MKKGFCVMGSGSRGNASLLWTGSGSVLIDAGFKPDELSERMASCDMDWEGLDALILTHTHGDHIKKRCLQLCMEHNVKFFCHEDHAAELIAGRFFKRLQKKNLVQIYGKRNNFSPAPGITAHAVEVSHDREPTFSFRFALQDNPDEEPVQFGYICDLGWWPDHLTEAFMGLDAVALEFNHDEQMERNSPRPYYLINRVLGKRGHLSNRQAGDALRVLMKAERRPQWVVQLHLSEDCNRPKLAYDEAKKVADDLETKINIFSSRQHQPGRKHTLKAAVPAKAEMLF